MPFDPSAPERRDERAPSAHPPSGVTSSHATSAWWHDVSVPPRPALTKRVRADVCVVGLGGTGLAAVREAQALGQRVIGVEAGRIAGAAAGRNGGLLLGGMADFHHDAVARWGREPAAVLYRQTVEHLAAMRTESPEHTWWRGSLRIADSAEELQDCERQLETMRQDGLRVQLYEGPEGRGLFFPDDGACHPVRRALALAELAERGGAVLYEGSPAVTVREGLVELATGGQVIAPAIVVCSDGALGRLVPEAAERLRSVRLQMLATAPTTDVRIPVPVYARYGYDYWQQLADGRVLLGGGRDRFEAEEYTDHDTPTDSVQGWLEERLRQRIGTQAAITHRWAATVTYTDDGLPLVDRFGFDLWGVGGFSGTGNVVGSLCGRSAMRAVLGRTDAFLAALRKAREKRRDGG